MGSRFHRAGLAILLVVFQTAACSAMDSFIFKVIPDDEQLVTNAGTTVGWGYILQNESRRYWLVTKELKVGSFQHGKPQLIFDFPSVPPASQVSVPYDAENHTGLYQLAWKASAPPGFANHGHFRLRAEWWSGDPAQGGVFVMKAFDASRSYFTMIQP